MKKYSWIIGCLIGLFVGTAMMAQDKQVQELSADEIKEYKSKVDDLVKYLEGTLNFIGDPGIAPREKEIAISETYLKVFRDDKVQIEDDLDEYRDVPLHKDVQAYLKDIRFFFRKAEFKFHVVSIDHFVNEENGHFFKVTFNRDLNAVSVPGDTINSRKIRYMEVNLDPEKNDLKIASIYTTKLNKKEEIRNWWNGLNSVWRNIFGKELMIYDTIRLSEVSFVGDSIILISREQETGSGNDDFFQLSIPESRRLAGADPVFDTVYTDTREIFKRLYSIAQMESMDISGMEEVKSLDPLSELSELKEINCSGTTVTDLFPVRNLNKLQVLDISNTPVYDLSPIRYSNSINELRCSFTLISDPEPLKGLYNLEKLECSGLRITSLGFVAGLRNLTEFEGSETMVHDGSPLKHLVQLRSLDISGTLIGDLEFASDLLYLHHLNCENTPVSDLDPLRNLEQLEILKISNTAVESLSPLESLENLKRIYWDSKDPFLIDSKKRRERAIAFMDSHPGTLVIFETDELAREWENMEERWRIVISEAAGISENPAKEDLHKVIRIESVSLTGGSVKSLKPLQKLYNLKQLDISGLSTEDYSPIGELIELESLDMSNTDVSNLDFLSGLQQLKILNVEHTNITGLKALEPLVSLEYVYTDGTGVNDEDAFSLRAVSPECLIVYKSNVLIDWWQALSIHWQEFFMSEYLIGSPPSAEQLHRLLFLESLEISGKSNINSLTDLAMLSNLRVLKMDGLQISNMNPIVQLRNLRILHITRMPVSDLSFVTSQINLEELNLEDTPVDDLKPVSFLLDLQQLNISGTQVRNLRPLSDLGRLSELYLNNTRVRNLRPVMDISSLELLQCYNTRISTKNVERFREANPDCKVVYY